MTNFFDSISEFNNTLDKKPQRISGILGLPIDGLRTVEVLNRAAFVYVRLRDNQNEAIQAFNDKVSPVYGLPVIVIRKGNRYEIEGRDTERYSDWQSYSPFLPRHGNTHSFSPETGGGGDIVWVYSRQFMPLLSYPSGSLGSPNILVSPYPVRDLNGNWKYIGNTGTANIVQYKPTDSQAIMGLVYMDVSTGNPGFLIASGTPFAANLTGTADILPYVPGIPGNNPNFLPDSFIRLVSGTSVISWDNIYDARQFISPVPTGTSGGGLSSIAVQDEGAPQGNATTFNFLGANVDVSVSGSVARVFVTGASTSGLDATYLRLDASNDPVTGRLEVTTNVTGNGFSLDVFSHGPGGAALRARNMGDDESIFAGAYHNSGLAGSFEQRPSGTSENSVQVLYLNRTPQFGNPRFVSPMLDMNEFHLSGSLYGGFLRGTSNSVVRLLMNPTATGTSPSYIFDTAYGRSTGTYLLAVRHTGATVFGINEQGYPNITIPTGTYMVGGIPHTHNPVFQRNLVSDITLLNGECLVSVDYVNQGSYTITLQGDSVIAIVDGP